MIEGQTVLAVIPARGGSKRLPGKNLFPLAGKPLIAYSIKSARNSEFVDRVIVSTDSTEIAEISRLHGADTPFFRPAELSTDEAATGDVIIHCLKTLQPDYYDIVLILQPTSPLRRAEDIDAALTRMISSGGDGIVSVCPCDHSPLWSNYLPKDCNMEKFLRPEIKGKRSQDLPIYYRLNGALYAYYTRRFLEQGGIFYSAKIFAWIMPSERSIDIDSRLDIKLAEFFLLNS